MIKPLPPGHKGLPIVGETLSFVLDEAFVEKRYREFGPIFRTQLIGRPTVVMVGPEAVELVLSSRMDHFSWREGWPDNFQILLGESLFLQDGEEHRKNRRLMMPSLHGAALVQYVSAMKEITRRYLQKWEVQGEFVWFEEFKQLTFDIASELLLGTKTGEKSVQLSRSFTTMTQGLFALSPLQLPFTTFGKAIAARNAILDHLTQVVREKSHHPTQDVLSLLCQTTDEEGNQLTEKEVRDQAMLLLFAGHETTTSMLTWLCLELAQNPEVLAKARAEQNAFQGAEMTLEQLGKMPYLDQILSEVERLHPPVGGGFRGVVKPFEFNGYHVPAGWMVLYSILVTHRLPELYPNPHQFNPDRFHPSQKQRPFSLIGFGGGPRLCIGIAFAKMEMKVVAAHLLRHYEWELLTNQDLKNVAVPTSRPKDGLKVKFRRVKSTSFCQI